MKSVLKALPALRTVVVGASLSMLVACGGGGCSGSVNTTMQTFAATVLVSDGAVPAAHTDPNLKNGWGVAFNPNGFAWVADNATNVATLYDGNGVPQTLFVSIPNGMKEPANPTGMIFNGPGDSTTSQNGKPGVAAFVFSGEGGTITAWSPAVAPTAALLEYDDGDGGAVYKGLALAADNGNNFLYATDFHNNKIDVFDKTFAKVAMPGGFRDPSLPAGFAPFGIQAIGSRLFVTYAQQDPDAHDDVAGAGLGFVDVFDTEGNFKQRFASGGVLNAPWGITQAPSNFGPLSNAILIGNFGDGMIHAFDQSSGLLMGTLNTANGAAFVQPGLWGIAFGNGLDNQPVNTLFFAAGPNDEANGVYGRIDVQTTTSSSMPMM